MGLITLTKRSPKMVNAQPRIGAGAPEITAEMNGAGLFALGNGNEPNVPAYSISSHDLVAAYRAIRLLDPKG
jgi:hypothetical protein